MGEDHALVTDALVALGDMHLRLGQESQVVAHYHKAPKTRSPVFREYILLKTALVHFFKGDTTSALSELITFRTMREESKPLHDEEYFVALLVSGVCEYLDGNQLEAKKCYKAAHSISKELKLFESDPASKKALRKSHGKVNQIHLSDIYGRIKRAILMQGRSQAKIYNIIEERSQNETETWFFYLHNDPLNKEDGWYAFGADMCRDVEWMYKKYVSAKTPEGPSRMIVSYGTTGRDYEIDFQTMQQTNLTSGTKRPIKRSVDGHRPGTRRPSLVAVC